MTKELKLQPTFCYPQSTATSFEVWRKLLTKQNLIMAKDLGETFPFERKQFALGRTKNRQDRMLFGVSSPRTITTVHYVLSVKVGKPMVVINRPSFFSQQYACRKHEWGSGRTRTSTSLPYRPIFIEIKFVFSNTWKTLFAKFENLIVKLENCKIEKAKVLHKKAWLRSNLKN